MQPKRLLARLRQGHLENVDFSDTLRLARAFGFRPIRSRGSHELLAHPQIPEFINLQSRRGTAKAYQLRQFLDLVDRYDLRLEES